MSFLHLASQTHPMVKVLALGVLATVGYFFLATTVYTDAKAEHLNLGSACIFCPSIGTDPKYSAEPVKAMAMAYCEVDGNPNNRIPLPNVDVVYQVNYAKREIHSNSWGYQYGAKDVARQVSGGTIEVWERSMSTHGWPKEKSKYWSVASTNAQGIAIATLPALEEQIINSSHGTFMLSQAYEPTISYRVYDKAQIMVVDAANPNGVYRNVIGSVPNEVVYNGQKYTINKSVPVRNPTETGNSCAKELLPPMDWTREKFGTMIPAPNTNYPRAWAPERGTPGCRFRPDWVNDNTKSTVWDCSNRFEYTHWGYQDRSINHSLFVTLQKRTAQPGCSGAQVDASWPMRTFHFGWANWAWSRRVEGEGIWPGSIFQTIAQNYYGGIIESPIYPNWRNYDNPFQYVRYPGETVPAGVSSVANHYKVPTSINTNMTMQQAISYPALIPQFIFACSPGEQPVVSEVKLYPSEAKDCPPNTDCETFRMTENRLAGTASNVPIGTYTNADNPRTCAQDVEWSANGQAPQCQAATNTILTDVNPFMLEVTVANKTDQTTTGVLPWQQIGTTRVVLNNGGQNTPSAAHLEFSINPDNLDTRLLCLKHTNDGNTLATPKSGSMANCITDSNCQACVKFAQRINGVSYEGKANRGITFRYTVGFRDQPGNGWSNGGKNIFVRPTTKSGTLAPNSNNGWVLVGQGGQSCRWNGSTWLNSSGAACTRAVLDWDSVAPTGSATVQHLSTLPANTMQFSLRVNATDDAMGYFGRMVERCDNGNCNSSPALTTGNTTLNGREARQTFSTAAGTNPRIAFNVAQVEGGDVVRGGMFVYDKANNAGWIATGQVQVAGPWLKTSVGDVYSYGGFSNFTVPSVVEGAEDAAILGRLVSKNFRPQHSTLSSFSLMTNQGSVGVSGGYNSRLVGYAGVNGFLTFNYNEYNNTRKFLENVNQGVDNTAFYFGWYQNLYAHLLDVTRKNCTLLGQQCDTQNVTSANLATQLSSTAKDYKFLVANGGGTYTLPAGTICRGVNVVFVEKGTTIEIQNHLVAANDNISGCLFVVDGGDAGSPDNHIRITDTNAANGGDFGLGATAGYTDVIEASFILEKNATFTVEKGSLYNRGGTQRYDRLILRGFVFSATSQAPQFKRDLVHQDNTNYPAEWLLYDPRTIDLYRSISGEFRETSFYCNDQFANHPECHRD